MVDAASNDVVNNSARLVTIFGGSGFVGRHVVRALAKRGWRIRVATRRPDLAFHLQPIGRPGQIQMVQANVRFPDSVAHALRGSDAVINLVGVLAESGRQSFDAVHEFGARAVAKAAKEAGVGALIQMSALSANSDSPSAYAASKGVSSWNFIDRAWNFSMYGTTDSSQTFHAEHLASKTHGTHATSIAVRTDT